MGFVVWEPASRCTSGPQPGAVALMNWVLEHYEKRGAANLGIYSCRPVRGGEAWSLHSEGRALDIKLPLGPDGKGTELGHRLVRRLRGDGERLGIQCMIYDRRIWSAKSPDGNGREYTGAAPHYDHIHLELNWRGARELDPQQVARILGGKPARTPRAVDFGPFNRTAPPGRRRLRLGSAGNDVKHVQEHIGRQRCGEADGYFGHQTKSGVRWHQDLRGVRPDGVVGQTTWAQILGQAPAVRPQPKQRRARVDLSRIQQAARNSDASYPAGTRIVQRALRLETDLELGDHRGVFDALTTKHYAAWQRSLGFRGADADGIPGEESLRRLGKQYDFDVSA